MRTVEKKVWNFQYTDFKLTYNIRRELNKSSQWDVVDHLFSGLEMIYNWPKKVYIDIKMVSVVETKL